MVYCHSPRPKTSQTAVPDANLIVIPDVSKPYSDTMRFRNGDWFMRLEVVENTLDDTARYYQRYVPPRWTGVVMEGEFLHPNVPFRYIPYRAGKGRLVFRYSSKKNSFHPWR